MADLQHAADMRRIAAQTRDPALMQRWRYYSGDHPTVYATPKLQTPCPLNPTRCGGTLVPDERRTMTYRIHTPGPLTVRYEMTAPDGTTTVLNEPSSHWWTDDTGTTIGYLTDRSRHAVALGPVTEHRYDNPYPTYSVISGGPAGPASTTTITPVPDRQPVWWDDDRQPDRDLQAQISNRSAGAPPG